MSFADKFSRFKMRFAILFWVLIFSFSLKIYSPFIFQLYSIIKFQKGYYLINHSLNKVEYHFQTKIPKSWVPLVKISKDLQAAIIVSEDDKFYQHQGHDSEQLQIAINDYFIYKKKMRGASTITQQLVKNLYLTGEKTFTRKVKELFLALMLEKYADKQKILETYLNIIEYGKGIYGIKQAADYYFKKSPAMLNTKEAAFLAMLLPNPKKYARSFERKMLTPFAKKTIDSILYKMFLAGHISENQMVYDLGQPFSWEVQTKRAEIDLPAEQ